MGAFVHIPELSTSELLSSTLGEAVGGISSKAIDTVGELQKKLEDICERVARGDKKAYKQLEQIEQVLDSIEKALGTIEKSIQPVITALNTVEAGLKVAKVALKVATVAAGVPMVPPILAIAVQAAGELIAQIEQIVLSVRGVLKSILDIIDMIRKMLEKLRQILKTLYVSKALQDLLDSGISKRNLEDLLDRGIIASSGQDIFSKLGGAMNLDGPTVLSFGGQGGKDSLGNTFSGTDGIPDLGYDFGEDDEGTGTRQQGEGTGSGSVSTGTLGGGEIRSGSGGNAGDRDSLILSEGDYPYGTGRGRNNGGEGGNEGRNGGLDLTDTENLNRILVEPEDTTITVPITGNSGDWIIDLYYESDDIPPKPLYDSSTGKFTPEGWTRKEPSDEEDKKWWWSEAIVDGHSGKPKPFSDPTDYQNKPIKGDDSGEIEDVSSREATVVIVSLDGNTDIPSCSLSDNQHAVVVRDPEDAYSSVITMLDSLSNSNLGNSFKKQIRDVLDTVKTPTKKEVEDESKFYYTDSAGNIYTMRVVVDPNSPSIAPLRYVEVLDASGEVVYTGTKSFATDVDILLEETRVRLYNLLG